MIRLFFSYSHKDEPLRDELEIHLSMLKRQGIIDVWHDRRIGAGSELDHSISKELDSSDIVLLLVSPYFLASDYCYDVEMTRALERHECGSAKVIPVILHPCDWHSAPFGKLMATPTDGKPVSKFPNQHDAFLNIVSSIKKVALELTPSNQQPTRRTAAPTSFAGNNAAPLPRSSNLRVKKEFTDQQKDEFLDDSFDYIAKFFEGSLQELANRNGELTSKFRRIDANCFTAVVYRDGATVTQCKVSFGGQRSFLGGITYSTDLTSSNSFNESLSVEDDGHTLYLKAMGMMRHGMGGNDYENMSQEGAAEYLWTALIERLQY